MDSEVWLEPQLSKSGITTTTATTLPSSLFIVLGCVLFDIYYLTVVIFLSVYSTLEPLH